MVLTLQIGTGRQNGRGPQGRFIWDVTGRVYTARSLRSRPDRARIRGLRRPRQKMRAQKLAPGPPGREAKGIDHREPEAARRHGVLTRLLVLMERHLHARHPWQL